jgi:hypothetical protein
MATKNKAPAKKAAKPKGVKLTWMGGGQLRVLLADGTTEMFTHGQSFSAHPDWAAAVEARQPEKWGLLE